MFLCEWCLQFNWIFRVLLEASSLCLRVTQVSISLSLCSHSLSSGDKVWGRNCFCTDDMALLAGLGLTGKFCKPPVKSIPVHPDSSFNFLRPISSKHLPFREVFIAEESHQRVQNTVLVGERQVFHLVCSQSLTCLQKGCPGIWHQGLWWALSSSKEKPGDSLPSNVYLHINEDTLHWNQNNIADMKHIRLRIREEKQQVLGWVTWPMPGETTSWWAGKQPSGSVCSCVVQQKNQTNPTMLNMRIWAFYKKSRSD